MAGETPKLWSKLENAANVANPEIGVGGAEVGNPTYLPAKFNNGIFSDIDPEGCTFPTGANSINLDKGTIEFWIKTNFANTDDAHHWFFDFRDPANGGISCYFNKFDDGIRAQAYTGGGAATATANSGALVFAVGTLIHIAVVWDRAGVDIGGGKTLAIYIDNVQLGSSVNLWAGDTVNANLYLGIDNGGITHSDAVIDNLKTHDICKTDFSDKDTEGPAPSAANTLVQAALISLAPLVALPTLYEIGKFTGGRV